MYLSIKRRVNLVLFAALVTSLGGCLGGSGGGVAAFGGAGSEFGAQAGLSHVGVAAAFDAGYTGQSVRVGIVDSGVDGRHAELRGRINAGGDWQNSGNGLSDPNGHGTHVASIVAAAADGTGMQGVAPGAELYSYRILDSAGRMSGQTSEAILPSVVSRMQQQQIRIVNNSWGSDVAIDDVSADTISSVLPRELSAWDSAVANGMVMVWAAGNSADHNVSVRAGLPYYYSNLRAGWLTVVSSGAAGTEPYYTNRCGLAAEWCITAPGGGDDQARSGVYAARSGGGYVRKSGTSMAAPHISGGLAVLMDAFPSLNAQAAARRMLATADYDGLVAANGCTQASCGSTYMRSVFGVGQMNLSAALRPVLPLSVQVNQQEHDVLSSRLQTSPALYQGLKRALSGVLVNAKDPFDGAEFKVRASDFLSLSSSDQLSPRWSETETQTAISAVPVASHGRTTHYLLSPEQPALPEVPQARLTSLSAQTPELRYVAEHGHAVQSGAGLSITAGFSEQSSSLSVTSSWQRQAVSFWAGQGVSISENSWLDSTGTAAFMTGQTRQLWQFAGVTRQHGQTRLQAEALVGTSHMQAPDSLIRAADLVLSSWELSVTHALSSAHSLQASVFQPIRIETGKLTLSRTALSGPASKGVSVPKREYQFHFGWNWQKNQAVSLSAYQAVRINAGHVSAKPDHHVGIQLKWIL